MVIVRHRQYDASAGFLAFKLCDRGWLHGRIGPHVKDGTPTAGSREEIGQRSILFAQKLREPGVGGYISHCGRARVFSGGPSCGPKLRAFDRSIASKGAADRLEIDVTMMDMTAVSGGSRPPTVFGDAGTEVLARHQGVSIEGVWRWLASPALG